MPGVIDKHPNLRVEPVNKVEGRGVEWLIREQNRVLRMKLGEIVYRFVEGQNDSTNKK